MARASFEKTVEIDGWHRAAQKAIRARNYKQAHELCLLILNEEPTHADAIFLLGIIAAEHGNFRKAVEVIQRAIAADDSRAEYFAQLGRCLVALLRPTEGLVAARRAFALNPRDAITLDTIGVVMARAGEHADAIEPFRQAVAIDDDNPAYLYNFGSALQFVGDFEGAGRAYRRALEIDATFYRAWSSLAALRRLPFDDQEVTRLENLLTTVRQDGTQADAVLHVSHALAKQCEDAAEYAMAFQYLEGGKSIKRRTLGYSIDSDRAIFEAVARLCTPAFVRETRTNSNASAEPLFIVGMPRTGTTLVERIVSCHPDVFSAGELTNFALVMKQAAQTPSNLVLDVATLEAAAQIDWSKVGDAYIQSTRPRTGHTQHFIDKMPLNFLYAGFIHRALPNAKIICVRRNPIDTCLSNYRQLFATQFPYYNYSYDLLDTGRYYVLFDALMAKWRALLPEHFYEVHYEAVVDDLESEARKLIEFCGLDWHPACLSFHTNKSPVSTASSVQVRQPVYKTSVERWRHYERETEPLRALLAQANLL